jgi:sodium/potassium-transporting ATPase subunit alpha
MDATSGDLEKGIEPAPMSTEPNANDDEGLAQRAVAFPDDEVHEEHRGVRPKGVEMRRELTVEDKALAAAGYQHLDEKKGKKDFDNVDIVEHKLELTALGEAMKTHFDSKSPGSSQGLSDSEAKARLEKDGRNVLTPPRKKSALRKYFDCLNTMFNILLIVAGVLEYILLGIDYTASILSSNRANILLR